MNTTERQAKPTQKIRSVAEIMNEALMQEGWTREQLDNQQRTGDIIAELMAEGYSGENLDAELQHRISQPVLTNADANGATSHTAPGENRNVESRRVETGAEKAA